jgi:DNA replication protein DnaC
MTGLGPPPQKTCEHCGAPFAYTLVELRDGKFIHAPLGCSCEGAQAAREAFELARRRQERDDIVADRIQRAGLDDGKWARMTLDTWDPARNAPHAERALRAVRAYVAEMELAGSNWLFLSGPYGVGKTHLALGTLRRLAEERLVSVRVVVWPAHCSAVKSTYNKHAVLSEEELCNGLRKVSVLLIDDVDKQRPTEWALDKLYELVDCRYRLEKPTIFTANHSLGELVTLWGEIDGGSSKPERDKIRDTAAAVLSRIAGQLWGTIEIKGSDQRW